ncbi:exopolysaccharide biosynthesis polyprenyl glycosylphosphotransferase [Streptomyces sp. 4N509B]|uniref:exopolysaccharide biosynthesis polyprenyl glycosylphosphotransferase n=1 Tax=Streptomyces sp. 4N509B TaxID=3457413 RepID=UPI003FD21BCC
MRQQHHLSPSASIRRQRVAFGAVDGPHHGDGSAWYTPLALAADVLGVALPVVAVYSLAGEPRPLTTALVATACWTAVRAGHRRYGGRSRGVGEFRGLLATVHDWLVLVGLLAVLRVATGESSRLPSAAFALLPALLVTGLTGWAIHRHLTRQRRRALALRRVMVVGEAAPVEAVTARLAARTDHPYVVIGAVPVGGALGTSGVAALGRLPAGSAARESASSEGPVDDGDAVVAAAREHAADVVFVAPGCDLVGDRLRRLTWAVQDAGLSLVVATGLTDVARRRVTLANAAGLSLLHVAGPPRGGAEPALKATLDRAVAALGLLLLAPLLALLALAVRLDSPGPALFRQVRVGRHGEPFTMLKYRTMVEDAERIRPLLETVNDHGGGPLFKMRADPRVTRLGRLLRRTSLDELPQLVNVVRGQMSLVGPRPPLPEEVARYGQVEARRLTVRPGMTGLWQVGGRSELSWDEGLALDLDYADNWSVTGDLDVLARTVRAVVDGRGAY